jgi:hypothetical protein
MKEGKVVSHQGRRRPHPAGEAIMVVESDKADKDALKMD